MNPGPFGTVGHNNAGHPVVAPAASRPAPHNPFAVERPHAAPHLLERQGSFRGFAHLNNRWVFRAENSKNVLATYESVSWLNWDQALQWEDKILFIS